MLLTTSQVKQRTGFSLVKIRLLIQQGKLHGVNTSVGTRAYYMVPESSLEAFERGEIPSPKQETKKPVRNRRIDADVPKVFG